MAFGLDSASGVVRYLRSAVWDLTLRIAASQSSRSRHVRPGIRRVDVRPDATMGYQLAER